MPTKAASRNIDLDFLRGLAILSVVGFHLYIPATRWAWLPLSLYPFQRIGARGVDLFFVLSGFLVGGLLLKEYRFGAVDERRFLIRRVLKIWPAYYLFIAFQAAFRRHPWKTYLFQNVFHVQNYLGTSLGQTWSLAVEEHFYLALAFLLAWAARRRLDAIQLLGLLSLASLGVLMLRSVDVVRGRLDAAHGQTQNRIDSLLFGVMLAVLFQLIPKQFRNLTKRRWPLILASLTSLCLMFVLPSFPVLDLSIGYTLIPLGLTAFLALVHQHAGYLNKTLVYKLVAWIGLYSYGIYLWFSVTREPMRKVIVHLPTNQPLVWIASIFLQFAAAIAVGFFMTRAVEIPFLKLRERLFPAEIKGEIQESAAVVEIDDPKFPFDSRVGEVQSADAVVI